MLPSRWRLFIMIVRNAGASARSARAEDAEPALAVRVSSLDDLTLARERAGR
jgi:hypothetical protein